MMLNFLIGNYTNPIEYKDIYLGITLKYLIIHS